MRKENRRGNGIGYTIGEEISPRKIKNMLKVSSESSKMREKKVKEIEGVLEGKIDKLLVLVGPCSADLIDPVVEYAGLLSELQPQVPNLILIPRVYTAKPRTTGVGYKGKVIYPDPSGEANIEKGIMSVRKLHKEVLEKTGLVAADEMLNPLNYDYLDDILGYIAIGARSCMNPEHQEVASGAFAPIGVKNPPNGSLVTMINSISAVQHPQVYIGRDNRSRYTTGNPYAHAILRGASFDDGTFDPNYHHEDILKAIDLGKKRMLSNFGVIIDCNHGNSGKKPFDQHRIMRSVMADMKENEEIGRLMKGFMIEGYKFGGNQVVIHGDKYTPGLSITDPCQSWEDSQEGIGTKNTLIEMNGLYEKMKKS